MRYRLISIGCVLALSVLVGYLGHTIHAQLPGSYVTTGLGSPVGGCITGSVYTDSLDVSIWNCINGVWIAVISPGSITFQNSGTCKMGWTQLGIAGQYILLTIAANGDVGTQGGTTTYTPSGTISAIGASGSATVTTSNGNAQTLPSPTHTHPTPTFTGTAVTIQPPFIKLIGCSKN